MICSCSHRKAGFTNGGDNFWVCGQCGNPAAEYMASQGDEVLNLFRGGPLDGKAYETTTLLGIPFSNKLPLEQYRWTPEKITSALTGCTARVWIHITESNDLPVNTQDVESAKAQSPAVPKGSTMSENETPLLARRKELGLSRSKVATAAGTTEAKLYRIETAGSKTTDEEIASVNAALDQLANQQVVEAVPSA